MEVLFFALLVLMAGQPVDALDKWSSAVLVEEKRYLELGAEYSLPDSPEWKAKGNVLPAIFEPMHHAYVGGGWSTEALDQIGKAMQAWRGNGRINNMTAGRLREHLYHKKGLKVPGPPKRPNDGPPRWKTGAAIIPVAALIKRSGVALRKLLKLDMPLERVPTIEMELAAAQERAAEVPVLKAEVAKIKDAHKHSAARLAKKNTAVSDARKDERKKSKAAVKEMKQMMKADMARKLETKVEAAESAANARVADQLEKEMANTSRARKRARKVEGQAKAYGKCLHRAQKAEGERNELREQMESPESPCNEADDEPQTKGRRINGRFTALDWRLRELILAQEARRTPPSAINANITDVLRLFAEEEVVPLPSVREMQRMRNELTVVGECLAAFRVALCKRIISFGFDESTKFGLGLLSSNTQIEPHDAPGTSVDVVLRGASLTAGGDSETVAKSVDKKIFSHARRLLAGWKAEHERKFGIGSWAADGGPDPSQIGIHRLAEETVIMGDTCNGERKAKRLVASAAESAKRLEIGDEAWEAMSEDEREESCKAYIGDCHDHLRNIIVNAMANAATELLKDSLEDDLAEFSSYDRMSVDGMDLIRAAFKELHPGGAYAKGKGREGQAWRKHNHASAMWVPIYNAKGSRQDAAFDGSMSLFANWNINLDFLHGLVKVPRADNKLELFLWRCHRCNDLRALARINTLWKLVITDAMRWLSGSAKKLKDWSLVSADRVLELAEAAFVAIAADGRKLFDPTFDPFAEIAASQPAFAEWQAARALETVTAPDGTTKYRVYERVLAEARNPTGKGNVQATTRTIALAERMANAALKAMHDTKRAIAEKLTSQDGACAPAKRQKMHEATIGAHVNNSRCESLFGSYDYVGHIFRGASAAVLGGLAQQMRNRDLERAPNVASDRRKRKAPSADEEAPAADGFYHRLPSVRLQESLINFSRHEAVRARKVEREDLSAHDEAKLARREERVITLLNKAVEDYAFAKELFRAWKADTIKPEMVKHDPKWLAFIKDKPESEVLIFLRKQIEMRVIGLGWTQFATRWSSNKDSKTGTVTHLRTLLIEILEHEITARRMNELPDEAALPQQISRNLGQLGAVDEDAMEIEKRALFSTEELNAKSDAEMHRRIEAGISDSVEDLNAGINSGSAPAFDQALVGKRLEVLWPYQDKDSGARVLIWASGRVSRVADGLTDKRSPRAQTVLPAGMVLWAWDADPEFDEPAGEKWLALLPKKWNKQQLYSWRYDPREFSASAAPQRDPRRADTRAMDCDD